MEKANTRIEVYYKVKDYRGEVIKQNLDRLGYTVDNIFISNNYLLNIGLTGPETDAIAVSLAQSVTQDYIINKPYIPEKFNYAIEIGYLPGVTDNVAHTVREMIEDYLKKDLDPEKSVFSSITYFIDGKISLKEANTIALEFYNPLIERAKILSVQDYNADKGMGYEIPVVSISSGSDADEVNINIPDDDLMRLGKEGIPDKDNTRRGPLALDLLSLHTIQNYYENTEKRNPTDIELESIAQTWSEHCKHTIFSSRLDEIDNGIYKRYIKEATNQIRKNKGKDDFCISVFEDNAGGIRFDNDYIISDKVETHNSPSALDPFGGAITGIVGVNRDAIGFGMAAKPVANRYGYCFADPFDEKPLYREKNGSSKLLSPRRIMEGVVKGVNVGGNQSGIPTPQGFVYFDERYKGKPLVFVGTVGLIPAKIKNQPSVSKKAMPGDLIVMTGGRVGRDGIHGATFSSEALTSGSPVGAVQIGDPITQKKMSDAIVKEARSKQLYHSITDNGAGGLSCSVAEMARECGGFEVDLEKVPVKYPGMAPWQIWISESQERMTLSVPEDKIGEFLDLMKKRDVGATVIGRFNDSGRGKIKYNGKIIFNLDLNFLHDGLPERSLSTSKKSKNLSDPEFEEPEILTKIFHDMTGRLNTASFEFISTQYDHEVQAGSVIKPLQGRGKVNGNATVIRPVLDSMRGVVLSQGIYPSYSDIDTYQMAACTIDTAIRNAVSAGGSLDILALLDNFCWCDSNNPERLAELKDAARACFDIALAYGTPFISGKDSMFNDFKGYDEEFREIFISVPPTLLISSIGVIDNILKCQTIDFKFPGDRIYIIGETDDELGGSEFYAYMGEMLEGEKFIGNTVPEVDADKNILVYKTFEKAIDLGLIASSISIERGGLGLAIAKSAMAGRTGFTADIARVPVKNTLRKDTILYSESQGRLLVSVDPSNADRFESLFEGIPIGLLGTVSENEKIEIFYNRKKIVKSSVELLLNSYKGLFCDF